MTNQSFFVELQQYRGPMELLLYLVRRHEVEIESLPIHQIAQQYSEFLEVLEEIDINMAADFLEVASMLVELKLKAVLPRTEDGEDDDDSDPREDLVQRLLLYKEFKDVSILLDERSREWQHRFPRLTNDLPPRKVDPAEQPIHEVELWDLVSSFGRLLKNNAPSAESNFVLDDTPIETYMQRIHDRLEDAGQIRFSELFEAGMHKSAMVGMFLAILELVRHHSVRAEQIGEHGDIQVLPGDHFDRVVNPDQPLDYL